MRYLVVLALLFASDLYANSLTLEVSDDGEPIAMAEVILVDAKTKQIVDNQFTDKNGRYVFKKRNGHFHLMVSKNEYTSGRINDVHLAGKQVLKKLDLVPEAFSEADAPAGFGDNGDGCDD